MHLSKPVNFALVKDKRWDNTKDVRRQPTNIVQALVVHQNRRCKVSIRKNKQATGVVQDDLPSR
jgi:hypothetical protein